MQIGADGIGQLAGIVDPHGGDHALVVEVLALLDVLLEQRRHAADQRLALRRRIGARRVYRDDGPVEAFFGSHRQQARPLDAFDQDLDVAVRKLEALDNRDDRADLVDLLRRGIVHRRVVLRGKENPLVSRQAVFERMNARWPPHDERRHHVRKDHDVPDGHHRELKAVHYVLLRLHQVLRRSLALIVTGG